MNQKGKTLCEVFAECEGIKPCAHTIRLDYWYDFIAERWNARISYHEERQGKQYGGKVVETYSARRGTTADGFMRLLRKHICQRLKVFWT